MFEFCFSVFTVVKQFWFYLIHGSYVTFFLKSNFPAAVGFFFSYMRRELVTSPPRGNAYDPCLGRYLKKKKKPFGNKTEKSHFNLRNRNSRITMYLMPMVNNQCFSFFFFLLLLFSALNEFLPLSMIMVMFSRY